MFEVYATASANAALQKEVEELKQQGATLNRTEIKILPNHNAHDLEVVGTLVILCETSERKWLAQRFENAIIVDNKSNQNGWYGKIKYFFQSH